ncbi:hypothetical protein BKA69DRAFT_185780 [Paraphysoderma sedebokerense]|nr:hypothetical protein BKA69DRAFT_185780 [Paraphysoderma sedebokerense]
MIQHLCIHRNTSLERRFEQQRYRHALLLNTHTHMMSIPPVSHPSNSAISNCSIISDNMPTARRHSSSTSAEMPAIPSSSADISIQQPSKRTSNGKSKARTKSLQPQTLCPICELPLSSSEFDRHYAEELEELRLDDPSKSILLAYTDESYMPTKKRRAASLKSMSSDKPKRGLGQRAAVDVIGNVRSVLLKTKNARKSRGTKKGIVLDLITLLLKFVYFCYIGPLDPRTKLRLLISDIDVHLF